MKIFVTGGAGFIGSHVVDAYVKDGHDVVVIDNLSTGRRENLNPKAKFYQVDICSPEIEEIFKIEKPEVLNHHAAQIDVRKSVVNPLDDCRVNILGFLNLMEAARKNGIKKVIFASSGGAIYGEQQEFPATEEHPTNPISPYGVAKLTCEKYLHYYYVQYGIPYVSLRYANVYGPRQNAEGEAGVVAIFINKMLKNEQPVIYGDGKQTRDYVFVSDVAKVNQIALHFDLNGSCNVGTGAESSVCLVFGLLKNICKVSLPVCYGASKLGEQKRSIILSTRLKESFGFSPTVGLNAGLELSVDWFKNVIF